MPKYGITILDKELACAPFSSPEGQDYYAAMACAANMAFANRQVITHRIREVFAKVFQKTQEELGIKLGYSVTTSKEKISDTRRKDKYYVRLNMSSKTSFVRKNQINLVHYRGKVYCVTVPRYHILCTKRREKIVFSGNSWRPFAPSMIESAMSEYVEKSYKSPFMILTFVVKEDKRKEIAEAAHVDHTVRVQSVTKDVNMRYYRLLKEFEKITSTPVLLNTSFNDNDEPIVMSPKDALRTYMVTGMDCLVIGNYLLSKKK